MPATPTPATTRPPAVRRLDLGRLHVQEAVYPPLHRMAPHADGVARVSVLVAGAVEETVGGVTHWSGPGSAVVKPAGTVHANRFGPFGARVLSVIPDSKLLEEVSGEAAVGATSYRWCHRSRPSGLADAIGRAIASPDRRG